ncbi:D-alanine transaminase [Cupriavidus metallidurans]|jgi:D-alanine transaminase|uniref:D-amino-acid transaminase, aminotransferase class IV ( D-alanine transaminase) n=1 Tax=Cupriavidus metallidurans (strain ATCC 43123 / DSM 2839 / NBRC 102507 / CH34) TaxID=266264 RepID=Q1LL48_CUPMC|nr:D-amino acid aminotransferase [Cupriavidus metallidurans]ABF09128.1 D-amino-acid transaminase, aminotransferase class IV (D-alanine transaminase) [Cupriavidus metallidurans CH34]AVA36348.1 D-amino acid aminotransferase [Cupriavidus metallidurans]KWW37581.1 D-alanine aminotransferase [Cupriavidus metallidurans]MDE4918679.1 D-amino acid aminotransferase [Cupriavidus metallidurans]QGS29987.1 D-amino acid aminotransferase [Cupriavidus metallidurans]
MSETVVFLNGELLPLSEARVPVLDRGFIFGDGIYEVIPLYNGKPFRGAQHLARLQRSLASIGIPNPYSETEWLALIDRVVKANGLGDQMVYMQVTRGVAKRTHAFPTEVTPTVLIMTNPMALPPAASVEQGVACVTMEDRRWLNCQIKSTSLLGNVLAAQVAAEAGVTEAIQFRDGNLTEASSSNVWLVKNGRVYAPPKDNLILEGIRYGLMEELCAAMDIPFEARRITRDEVFSADEVLLSSASKELLPVVTIDGKTIGAGKPGPVFQRLFAAYQAAKSAL